MFSASQLTIRPMTPDDIPAVYAIEVPSFRDLRVTPDVFAAELQKPMGRYRVIGAPDGGVLGYLGAWCEPDYWYLITIAVHPDHRGDGLAEWLIGSALANASRQGVYTVVSETRLSNRAPQKMGYKFGGHVVSVRPGFYLDNDEDALVYSSGDLQSPKQQAILTHAIAGLEKRYGGLPIGFYE
jgi:ribosomal-protein-alanine N-acetyltransferase